MSNEIYKHQVATDALDSLGFLIDDKQRRDAIHLAVEPVEAARPLVPGQNIGLNAEGKADSKAKPHLGIVDPFLKDLVQPGERFWMIVYPRTITSLRHVWSHPNFPDVPEVSEVPLKWAGPNAEDVSKSEAWLKAFIEKADIALDYEGLLVLLITGEYKGKPDEWGDAPYFTIEDYGIHSSGADASGIIPPEFWEHAEIVTGKKFDKKPSYFSCGC